MRIGRGPAEQIAELDPADRLGLLATTIAELTLDLADLRALRAQTIRELVDAGQPVSHVAQELGISRETAHAELRRTA